MENEKNDVIIGRNQKETLLYEEDIKRLLLKTFEMEQNGGLTKINVNNILNNIKFLKSNKVLDVDKAIECFFHEIVQEKLITEESLIKKCTSIISFFGVIDKLDLTNDIYNYQRKEVYLYLIDELDKFTFVMKNQYENLYEDIEEFIHSYYTECDYFYEENDNNIIVNDDENDKLSPIIVLKFLMYKQLLYVNKDFEFLDDYITVIEFIKIQASHIYLDKTIESKLIISRFISGDIDGCQKGVLEKDIEPIELRNNIYMCKKMLFRDIIKLKQGEKAYNELAKLYFKNLQFDLALKNINTAIKIAEGSIEVIGNSLIIEQRNINRLQHGKWIFYLNRALIYIQLLKYREAINDIQLAIDNKDNNDNDNIQGYFEKDFYSYNNDNSIIKFLLSVKDINDNEQINALIGEFIFKFLNPNNLNVTMGIGVKEKYNNRFKNETAILCLEKAYNYNKNNKYLEMIIELKLLKISRITCRLNEKQYEEIIGIFKEIPNNKMNYNMQYLYGYTLYYAEKYEKAKKVFKVLSDRQKNNIEYLRMYYNSLFILGEYNELLDCYNSGISPYGKEITDNNIMALKDIIKQDSLMNKLKYNINEQYKINIQNNEKVFKYKKTVYDFKYDELNQVDYRDDSKNNNSGNVPFWLDGSGETEEEFWEHT